MSSKKEKSVHASIFGECNVILTDIARAINRVDRHPGRLLQDRGILSRIFETAATARLQVGVMLAHEREWGFYVYIT